VQIEVEEDGEEDEAVEQPLELYFGNVYDVLVVRIEGGEEADPSKLGMKWEIVSISRKEIQIQLVFDNPLFI